MHHLTMSNKYNMNNESTDEPEENIIWTWAKRISLLLIAVFLFYLMFTYMGIGPDILQIFEGQIESKQIDANYTLYINNETRVVFTEQLYGNLFNLYVSSQENEFKACLYGTIEEGEITTYLLDGLAVPETYSQSVYRVVSAGCDKDTLVSLHSHPYKHCLLSDQDIKSYEEFLKKAPDALLATMCEEDRFTFYKG